MTTYDRFEYLEIDECPRPLRRTPAPAPRVQTEAAVAGCGERKLVVNEIIGRRGSAIGEFNCPAGLAVDRQGSLYVADSYNHRIQRIAPNGTAVAIGGKGTAPGCFLNPQDIGVDDHLAMYVLEQGNCRIQKITFDGRPERVMGRRGGRPGEFNSPMGAAIDRHGCIFVADTGNGRLQKLSATGVPIYCVSSNLDRKLYRPQGVETDPAGNCYVADTFCHCIVKFDPNGGEIARFGSRGVACGQFDEPQDLALDRDGTFYVVEMANNRL